MTPDLRYLKDRGNLHEVRSSRRCSGCPPDFISLRVFGHWYSPSTASSGSAGVSGSAGLQRARAPLAFRCMDAARTTTPRTASAYTPRQEDRQWCVLFISFFILTAPSHARRRWVACPPALSLILFTLLSNFSFLPTFILHHHHPTFWIPRNRGGKELRASRELYLSPDETSQAGGTTSSPSRFIFAYLPLYASCQDCAPGGNVRA